MQSLERLREIEATKSPTNWFMRERGGSEFTACSALNNVCTNIYQKKKEKKKKKKKTKNSSHLIQVMQIHPAKRLKILISRNPFVFR